MLALLHAALWVGVESAWVRPLLLAHLGLFMVWQPLWQSEAKLSLGNAAFILTLSLSALFWLNWWVLAFWVSGLFALVGGRVFTFHSRWQRAFYLLLMAYLLAVLLLYVAPRLFGLPEFQEVTNVLLVIGLPLLLFIMAVLPPERGVSDNVQAVDFIYVLLLFMLLVLLMLGSLAFMTLGRVEYLVALIRTLFLLGAALMVLGLLWSPRMGFAGLQASFSRYVLSIGTPLEEWLKQIALAAQQEQNPVAFLERATAYLIEMPSISGISWLSEEGHGDSGVSSQHRVDLAEEDLALTLFTHKDVSPTVLLHMRLLVQVLGHFYQAKRREQRLREMTRQQTIYETGARLTHDLKNMLQSLFALTSVAQHDSAKAQPILKNQLPILTQRIESLLTKLKAPGEEGEDIKMSLSTWWESACQRHQHRGIEWVTGELADELIPAPLFDCVLDNLLENANNKRLREPNIQIWVTVSSAPRCLEVRDTGSAVPEGVARNLLRTVVPSEDGLGVGMYQAARWSQQMGYRLILKENREGAVRFELSPAK
ncbi:MAG: sensor histidine kinase [Sideroxydans sp.]